MMTIHLVFTNICTLFCPFREIYPHTCSPSHLVTNLLSHFFQVPNQSNPHPQPKNQCLISRSAISPSEQNELPGALLKILSTGTISFRHRPSRMSPKKACGVAALLSGDVCILPQTSVSQAHDFSSLVNRS